jgi:thiol-disulfide isomerase/thioredoxin
MKRVLFLLLFLLPFAVIRAQKPFTDYRKAGSAVPSFVLHKLSGGMISNKVLRSGKPFMFLIFSPQCDHCAKALDSLHRVPGLQPSLDLVLVTEARNKPFLADFMKQHGFDTIAKYRTVGLDSGKLIQQIYNFGMLPQFSIYNAQHKFVRSFSGIFPLDSLKPYLR